MNNDEIGGVIRKRRKNNGLSIAQLATKIGTTPQHVSLVETGKNTSVSRLITICEALHLTLEVR